MIILQNFKTTFLEQPAAGGNFCGFVARNAFENAFPGENTGENAKKNPPAARWFLYCDAHKITSGPPLGNTTHPILHFYAQMQEPSENPSVWQKTLRWMQVQLTSRSVSMSRHTDWPCFILAKPLIVFRLTALKITNQDLSYQLKFCSGRALFSETSIF